jgi:hypothetical protein
MMADLGLSLERLDGALDKAPGQTSVGLLYRGGALEGCFVVVANRFPQLLGGPVVGLACIVLVYPSVLLYAGRRFVFLLAS